MFAGRRGNDQNSGMTEFLKKALAESFQHTILLPPLRERRSDIPVMLNAFLGQFCKEYGCREKQFDDESLELLVNYDWPGNVKELKNLTEKMVVSVPTKTISAQDFPSAIREEAQHASSRSYEHCASMAEAEAAWRKNYLLHHLRKNDRNVAKTAAAIHIREKELKKLIKEYGIVFAKENPSGKRFQRTLKRAMVVSGQGLHSGDKTGLILTPLPPGSGISIRQYFKRRYYSCIHRLCGVDRLCNLPAEHQLNGPHDRALPGNAACLPHHKSHDQDQ